MDHTVQSMTGGEEEKMTVREWFGLKLFHSIGETFGIEPFLFGCTGLCRDST